MKIDKQDSDKLIDWIEKYHSECYDPNHKSGYVRGYPNINNINNFLIQRNFPYEVLIKLEKDIYNHFDFDDSVIKDPSFGWFLSYSTEGHEVIPHTDPLEGLSEDYQDIFRINFMLKKPVKGGNPIINSEVINIEENDYWICHASKDFHTSEAVAGDVPRIVLSMGYAFTYHDLRKFKKRI